MKDYSEAIQLNPEYALVWTNKSGVLGELGRLEEALERAEKAIELDPKIALAWNNKAAAFLQIIEMMKPWKLLKKLLSWIRNGSVTIFLQFDNKDDYWPCILPNLRKRRTQDHDINRILIRLPYRSRGRTKEALDLILESRNAT